MNGYSKIKLVGSTKSRSMDLSDLLFSPENPKPIDNPIPPNPTSKIPQTKQIKNANTHESPSDEEHEEEEEDENGDRFRVILRRNFSVSSTSSHRFKFDKQGISFQSAVKRAFSMRRSSSVSERYCRIHDQCVTLASSSSFDDHDGGDDHDGDGDDEVMDKNNTVETRSVKKKKHRSGKILKACKRIFGL